MIGFPAIGDKYDSPEVITARAAVSDWQQVLVFIAIASMFLGAIAAIGQSNLKRLLDGTENNFRRKGVRGADVDPGVGEEAS